MAPLQSLHSIAPMNLASLSFVYIYLPVCLLVYYLSPKTLRPAVLLAASLGFAALSQPRYLPLLAATIIIDFGLTQGIVIFRGKLRELCLWTCIAKNVALIGYFGVSAQIKPDVMPFGLLIYCASGILAALEAHREQDPQPRGFLRFALYISFFPRIYAGPLMNPGEFFSQMGKLEFSAGGVALGLGRFAEGALKYAVFGRGLLLIYNSIRLFPEGSETVLAAWSLVLTFTLSLYYTLSGLADMARGLAGMFGLSLPQNFYYPYQSRSVSDFFERFNMTVGAFLKQTVILPQGLKKDNPVAGSLNIMLIGLLWGAWFGMRANYVLWGAFAAVFIIMEKYLYPGLLRRVPTLFCRGYSLFVILIGFTIFAGDNLGQSAGYFMSMLGSGGLSFANRRILYLLSSNWLLIALSCLLSTNAVSLLVSFLRKTWPLMSSVVFAAVDLGILVLFTAFSLGGVRL